MSDEVTSVVDVRPNDSGLSLTVKVLESHKISEGKRSITECLVGDSSGCILLTAKGDICTTLAAGKCVHIANAKTEMYKGSLRLQVFEGNATVEQVSESIGVKGLHRGAAILSQQRLTRCERVQKDMNMSLIEFETVIVSAAGQPRKKDNERQGGAEADAAAPDAEAEAPAKAA